jgi:hypothetical protein
MLANGGEEGWMKLALIVVSFHRERGSPHRD